MFKRAIVLLTPVLIFASTCMGQFFDDFEGDALGAHWFIGPSPAHLQHSVSGGLLHITDLPLPSNPMTPLNDATMLTTFTPLAGDFVARAVVGWAPGEDRRLVFGIGSTPSSLGTITYSELDTDEPLIRVQGGQGTSFVFPAPSAGLHEFVFTRTGDMMSTFLNGNFLASFPATTLGPIDGVALGFDVAFPNNGMAPMYVDVIAVVPSPATLVFFCAACSSRRRRRI